MKNFARAIRLALRRRFTVLGILFSSITVALLWGANIGTVYPFMEVVFQQDSIHTFLDEELERVEAMQPQLQATRTWYEQQRDQRSGVGRAYYAMRVSLVRAGEAINGQFVSTGRWILPALPDKPFSSLVMVVVFLLVATILKCLAHCLNIILVARLTHLNSLDLSNQFYRHTLNMELSTFGRGRTSELMSRFTNDISAVSGGISVLFGNTLREPLKMLVCLFCAAMISWQLLVLSLFVAPMAIILMYRLAKSVKRANRRALEEVAQVYNRLSESFTGIKAVQAYTMERIERSRFLQTSKQLYHKSMKISLYSAMIRMNNELLGVGVIALAMLSGGYLVLNGETHLLGMRMSDEPLSVPAMMLFFGFLVGVSDPARKLSDVFHQLQRGAAAADRIYPLLDQMPTIVDPPQPKQVPEGPCEVVFDRVSFAYEPDQLVLKDINLRIGAGEKLAIVGPNGCGKSTLTNLIPRFYDPVEGEVRLNYTGVHELRLRDLRKSIGIVTQQTLLFDDTIANNIRYGSPHATDEEVMEAAKKAQAHRFIVEHLPHGYQTAVGERGDRLSGGQRQRIALARAILRNPSILILDEATSQVDQESEQLIHRALESFMEGRTSLLITHRSSTLSLVDRILVMDEGRIVDLGTHDELLARCPLYHRLYQTEMRQTA
jgi:ATP-binding cassette, subfamily B, bacterial MsbA